MGKTRRPHVVPLAPRCLEILRQARALNPNGELLFPGTTGRALSDMAFTMILRDFGLRATAHGFRSTFRDGATEHDKCREVVAEAALSHKPRDKVEAAYRRANYLEEPSGLMQRWAGYCASQTS